MTINNCKNTCHEPDWYYFGIILILFQQKKCNSGLGSGIRILLLAANNILYFETPLNLILNLMFIVILSLLFAICDFVVVFFNTYF